MGREKQESAQPNPVRAYQVAQELDLRELAERLGISVSYAEKLAYGALHHVPVGRAGKFDERTGGELSFDDLIAWSAAHGHAPSAAVLENLERVRKRSGRGWAGTSTDSQGSAEVPA